MKDNMNKLPYAEPMTMVSVVESEGFICVSMNVIHYNIEVDELQNTGTEELDFNSDW